ncbi:Leucine-, isoleucine-, valine-, threonine-, and alanine-binding protein [Methanocorpusculaceae archaeon Sp1]|nr:Leucine-, isoleucine-, valine-, threonine-, and alanine-binding protein [Methanocorpusculaceae archaeon Sp1]
MSGSHHNKPPRTKWTNIIDAVLIVIMIVLFVIVFHPFGTTLSEPFPEDEVVIAAMLPLEGPLRDFGVEYQHGIEMAVEDVNAAGGIRGVPLRVEYFNDKGDENISVSQINEIRDRGIPIMIGAIGSGNSIAIAPYAQAYDILMLSPGSTAAALTSFQDAYRTVSSDVYQGGGMTKILGGVDGVDSVVVFYLGNQYGKSLLSSFEHDVDYYLPMTSVTKIEVDENKPIDTAEVTSVMKQANPNAVVLIVYPDQGIDIMQAANAAGLDPIWFGSDTMTSHDVPVEVGEYSEGMVGFTQAHRLTTPSFGERYLETYNETTSISFPVSYGYDAVMLLATCIADGGYSYEGVKDSLDKIRYVGIVGPRVFDENGDVQPAYDLMVIRDGSWQSLKWNEILTYDYNLSH